jgi:hypothetical protein
MATKPSTTHSRSIHRLLACAGTVALVAGGLLATGGAANAAQPAEPVVFDEVGFHVWTVPEGVTEVAVSLVGGSGGKGGGTNGGAGGLGAVVSGTQAVTPGQEFAVIVGQAGGSGSAPGEDGENGSAPLAAAGIGQGGTGYTDGGDGGDGSFLARDGGGGGGSSAFGDYDAGPTLAAVAAGGAGGAGRGVVGFCVGGDGGNAGEDGKAPRDDETVAPEGDPDFALHCLAEGDGGVVNASDDGNGDSGESVLFLGGGGGGGGASFYGDGVSGGGGGEAGALLLADDGDPETPEGSTGQVDAIFGLGGGGGGGAGGGSIYGSLTNASDGFGEAGDGSVTITYSVEYQTETTLAVSPASAVFGDEIVVTASVENLTTEAVPSGDVVLVVEQPLGATGDSAPLAAVEPMTATLVDGEAVFTIESGTIDAGAYHLTAVYQPTPISPFGGSEADTTLQVARIATTTQLAVDPTTVQAEKQTVMTATVVGAVGVVPTGDIAFYYDGELLGSEPLASGSNSVDVPISFIPVGPATITARYLGDVNFEPSDSNPVDITVTPIPTPTPTPTPTPKPATKPAGLANTGSGAADILPWSLLLLAGGALVAGAAGAVRVRARR